jgi:hypothetical protein
MYVICQGETKSFHSIADWLGYIDYLIGAGFRVERIGFTVAIFR